MLSVLLCVVSALVAESVVLLVLLVSLVLTAVDATSVVSCLFGRGNGIRRSVAGCLRMERKIGD